MRLPTSIHLKPDLNVKGRDDWQVRIWWSDTETEVGESTREGMAEYVYRLLTGKPDLPEDEYAKQAALEAENERLRAALYKMQCFAHLQDANADAHDFGLRGDDRLAWRCNESRAALGEGASRPRRA